MRTIIQIVDGVERLPWLSGIQDTHKIIYGISHPVFCDNQQSGSKSSDINMMKIYFSWSSKYGKMTYLLFNCQFCATLKMDDGWVILMDWKLIVEELKKCIEIIPKFKIKQKMALHQHNSVNSLKYCEIYCSLHVYMNASRYVFFVIPPPPKKLHLF